MMFDVVLYDDAYRVDALSVDVVCLKTWIVLVGSLLKIVDMFVNRPFEIPILALPSVK